MTASQDGTTKIVGIAGNFHRPSRTRALVETVVDRIGRDYGADGALFDLVDVLPELGTFIYRNNVTGRTKEVLEAIESCDALVVGTPVYKGSYTGLFKHLFDLVTPERLAGVPVVLTATGGNDRHALMIEHELRPLFAFFAASTVATGIYAAETDFVDGLPGSERLLRSIDAAIRDLRPWLNGNSRSPAIQPT
ncbi:MAG: FMN reductase [Xanthobacteraceae bacterium]